MARGEQITGARAVSGLGESFGELGNGALFRMVETNLVLGLPGEAQKAAAVLGANYPGSEWYDRAYKLMQKHAPATSAS